MYLAKAFFLAVVASWALAMPSDDFALERKEVAGKKHKKPKSKALPIPSELPGIEQYDWRERPWTHYVDHKILDKMYPVKWDQVNIDHDDIVTPSLPPDVEIPTPFLPTDNEKVKELYFKALAAYFEDRDKPEKNKTAELSQKWQDVNDFNEKAICYYSTHAFNLRCAKKDDAKARRWQIIKFRHRYHKLKNKLIDEMRVEGLVNFGRELADYLQVTGQTFGASAGDGRTVP
ncbi:hypothetical protein LZ554_001642 [Drepanopeziza brunnea f. sp. 'monogermtubi']|nr:hypothetical protein LZ554_001642 [Drepanopeziza brunnea f. sp. 'monogermtubi']